MATTRVFYKGKKELTMAQFEALTSLDDAIDYNITDFPNAGITNAQMTVALSYSRLFEDGDVFVCLDDGTYTKGHTYQVKVTNGVKSWEDITPGGDVEITATITPEMWQDLNGNEPFAKMASVTLSATISANSTVELINDQAVAFANYGFNIGMINEQQVVLFALDSPTNNITFTFGIRG